MAYRFLKKQGFQIATNTHKILNIKHLNPLPILFYIKNLSRPKWQPNNLLVTINSHEKKIDFL